MCSLKRVLYGTGNRAKLQAMRRRLADLKLEILGLQDMEGTPPEVPEEGKTPLENARQKAFAYYKRYGIPVFSCDSGLYLEGVPEELQPGVHVRTVGGKYLSDEEMQKYYGGLAEKYGDIRAHYENGVCLVLDEEHIYQTLDRGSAFLITAVPCGEILRKGFPLDSLSRDIATGKYFYELTEEDRNRIAVGDYIYEFMKEISG